MFHWKSAIAPCCCLDPPLTELELGDHRDRWMQLICRRCITRALPKSLLCKTHYVFLPCKTAHHTLLRLWIATTTQKDGVGSPESGHKQIFGRPVGNSFPLPYPPPPVSNTRLSVGQKLRRISDKRYLEFLSRPVKAVSVNKFFTNTSSN